MSMNRRSFLRTLGLAAAGGVVAYSFPSIIVPRNIINPVEASCDLLSQLNAVTIREIYPELIRDVFFRDTPFLAYFKDSFVPLIGGSPTSSVFTYHHS